MVLNKSIRQIHRWLSIIFTLTVIANFVTMAFGQLPVDRLFSASTAVYITRNRAVSVYSALYSETG